MCGRSSRKEIWSATLPGVLCNHIGFSDVVAGLLHMWVCDTCDMGWLQLVGSIKLQVSFAKEPYKRDDILQKRPMILSILLTVATP